MINVWWPNYVTEAHRKPGEGQVLADELEKLGIRCHLDPSPDHDFAFCGSFFEFPEFELRRPKNVPVVHYCWDLYPFQLETDPDSLKYNEDYCQLWWNYIGGLRAALKVWVPSACTVNRILEFTGRGATVVKCSVRPWEADDVADRGYVVDVMRKYQDPNRRAVRRACTKLGIPLIEMDGAKTWDEFKATISGARFLISPNWEASTGGLTLLEGLWHGKPCLCSDSTRNGAADYLGNHATYFQWDNPFDLMGKIKRLWQGPPKVLVPDARLWIEQEYSEAEMAARMAERFKELKR